MAEKGRLPRESNPIFGEEPGFVASHDTTGDEDYERTSPKNPLPTKNSGLEDKLNDIEKKLDSVIENGAVNTQVTGSNVEHLKLSNIEIMGLSTYTTDEIYSVGREARLLIRVYPSSSEVSVRIGHFSEDKADRFVYADTVEEERGDVSSYRKLTFPTGGHKYKVEITNKEDEDVNLSYVYLKEVL